jgi:hypothetical protein
MIMLVIGALVPQASAERDSLKVIILAENAEYKTGDNISLEVQVFDSAQLVEADVISVYVRTHSSRDEKEIAVEQTSTGKYKGSYEVQDEDYYLWFSAYAESGTDSDYAEFNAQIFEERLELDIHFSHQSQAYLWPGQSVTATLTTNYRNEPVDVDEFTYIQMVGEDDTLIELSEERVSEGVYKVFITIDNVLENTEYELRARALYANAQDQASAQITINVLTVWYHLETMAGHTATFSLGVADQKGKAVENAKVTIFQSPELMEYTDENGLALFSVTGVSNGRTIKGQAEYGELVQSFSGYIYPEDEPEDEGPSHQGFDVVYDGDNFIYSSGSKITRSYRAYNHSIPISNHEIYYYITQEDNDFNVFSALMDYDGEWGYGGTSKIIKTGSVSTNLLGEFSISFTAPKSHGLVSIYFETGTYMEYQSKYDYDDNLAYYGTSDYVFVNKGDMWNADSVSIHSDPLVVGGKTHVTVKTTQSPSDNDELFAVWMPGNADGPQNFVEQDNEWTSWVDGAEVIFLKETSNANEFEGDTVIPEFLPEDGDYTLAAGTLDGDSGYPAVSHATLKEGESAGSPNMDILVLILLGGAVLVILIILGFGTFTEKDKKKESSQYPGSQIPPGEGGWGSSNPPTEDHHSQTPPYNHQLAADAQADMPPPEEHSPPVQAEEEVPKSEDTRGGADK